MSQSLSTFALLVSVASAFGDHDGDGHEDPGLAFAITMVAASTVLIGALAVFCVKREQLEVIPASLGFASGVVIYLSFMALFPECIELMHHANGQTSESLAHFSALICACGGMAIAFLSKKCLRHRHSKDPAPSMSQHVEHVTEMSGSAAATNGAQTGDVQAAKANQPPTGDPESNRVALDTPENLNELSYTITIALLLHHIPEGIATFISLYYNFKFGALVAFALVVHDVPPGICIAVTTYCATGSKLRAFLLCLLAAAPYPIGALFGLLVVEFANEFFVDVFIGSMFGITAGIMLYIAFVELLPTAILTAKRYSEKNDDNMYKHVYTVSIAGIFAGFLVMDISTILLDESGGHSHI